MQSKYHELSIKHRQLLETSPQVATIWNEVLVQQAQAHGDAAAEQRLRNFDLRHTICANSGLSMAVGQPKGPAVAAATGEVSPTKLLGVSAAAAIFSGGGAPQGNPHLLVRLVRGHAAACQLVFLFVGLGRSQCTQSHGICSMSNLLRYLLLCVSWRQVNSVATCTLLLSVTLHLVTGINRALLLLSMLCSAGVGSWYPC